MVGNKQAIEEVLRWLESWKDNPPAKHAILLHGPPGVGKTVISEVMAKERGWDIVEVNASEKRTGDILSRVVGLASTQASLFAKGRLILLDEVDGINLREDHGAIMAVKQLIKDTRYPLILTANDVWDPKIRPLRDVCHVIELKRVGVRDGIPFLRRILEKEATQADEDLLRLLIEKNNGDLRSILTDLETIASGKEKRLTIKDADWLSGRDRTENIFNVLRVVFNAKTVAYAKRAVGMSEVDPDMLFQWIFENTPYQLANPIELSKAMQALAAADLFFARTRRSQDWHLVSYAYDLMTAGVAISKQTPVYGWIPMRFPQKIMAMSRSRGTRELRKSIGLRIGLKCHLSSRRAVQEYMPLLRIMQEKNPGEYDRTAEWLGGKSELDEYILPDLKPISTPSPKSGARKPRATRSKSRSSASDSE